MPGPTQPASAPAVDAAPEQAPRANPPPERPAAISDADLGRLLRAMLGIGLVFTSLTFFFNELFVVAQGPLVEANAIPGRLRDRLMGESAAALGLGLGAALLTWLLRRRSDGLRRVDSAARFLAPLMLLGLVPPLLTSWTDPLELSLALGAFVLLFEPLARLHLESYAALPAISRAADALEASLAALSRHSPRLVRRAGLLVVIACAAGYAAYTSFHTIQNHWRFNTFNYDLGQLDNLFYNALHGRPMRCTPLFHAGNWSELRNHAELSTFALLPFYALAPRAETLLVLQSCVIGAGAIPLYRLAARRLSQPAAALLALAYLLYAPMNEANYFDFHYQPVAAGFLLWMLDMFDDGRMLLFGLFYLLAIGCREDISVGLAVFGVFLMVTGTRVRWGLGITAFSSIYFVLLRFVVMPSFGQWGFQDLYRDLFPLGDNSFRGVMATLVSNPVFTFRQLLRPEKLQYSLQIADPARVPAAAPAAALALAPAWRLLHPAHHPIPPDHRYIIPILGAFHRLYLPGGGAGAGGLWSGRARHGAAPGGAGGAARRHLAHLGALGRESRCAAGCGRGSPPSARTRPRPAICRSSRTCASWRRWCRPTLPWPRAIASCRMSPIASTAMR